MVRVRMVWQVQSVLVGLKVAKLYPIVVGIVLLSKYSTGHLFHTLGLAHGVEVQGRHAGGLELFALLNAPLNTHLTDFLDVNGPIS